MPVTKEMAYVIGGGKSLLPGNKDLKFPGMTGLAAMF
jgi:hypothetical protein